MIELVIALGAGLVSFLSPCVLPLIPGYISFISGHSLNELKENNKVYLLPLFLFSLGFSFVFILLGATATVLGAILIQNSEVLRIIAGVIIIIFSLQLIGVINIKFLNYEKKYYTKKSTNPLFIFIVGMAFGFGWTPCIGPILGSILAIASVEESIFKGIILLSFYSLGLAIPFVLSGYGITKFLSISKNLKSKIRMISLVGGSILLITGILILANVLQIVGFYLLEIFPFLENFG